LIANAIRLFVCVTLGYYGGLYLVYTETTEDLVLNALALQFILDIDELIFRVSAPNAVRAMLERFEELPIPHELTVRGENFSSALSLMLPIVACFVTVLCLLEPALARRTEIWRAMCGNNKDFALAIDGLGRAHWSPTAPFVEGASLATTSYSHEAAGAVAMGDVAGISDLVITERNVARLMEMHVQTMSSASLIAKCVDADDNMTFHSERPWSMGKQILRTVTGNTSLSSCADAASWCQSVLLPGIRARQWCPITCGCHSMDSGLVIDEPGCPWECQDRYDDQSAKVSCDARRDSQALQDKGFVAYASGLRALFKQLPGLRASDLVDMGGQMASQGCGALAGRGLVTDELCEGIMELQNGTMMTHFRPVWPFCPIACGCKGKDGAIAELLTLSGQCNSNFPLLGEYIRIGRTHNRAPLYRSLAGNYIYYGSDCDSIDKSDRWILSPSLCSSAFLEGYTESMNSYQPPEFGAWRMRCSSGWGYVNITVTPVHKVLEQ